MDSSSKLNISHESECYGKVFSLNEGILHSSSHATMLDEKLLLDKCSENRDVSDSINMKNLVNQSRLTSQGIIKELKQLKSISSMNLDNSSRNQVELESTKDGSSLDGDIFEEDGFDNRNFQGHRQYIKVDKADPRTRLHFVNFLKHDEKIVKVWECGICGREFDQQFALIRHIPVHTDVRNFKCNECGKAFRQLSTLSQHKFTHNTQNRPYICGTCKKSFCRTSSLSSHMKIHNEKKEYKCEVCGRRFHQKVNLKTHSNIHSNERPYRCEYCGRGFNQSSNLQCHKAKAHKKSDNIDLEMNPVPANDQLYRCLQCSESFVFKSQLRQHQEYVHTSYANRRRPPILKRKKIGNVRIFHLPNGDRTFKEVSHIVEPDIDATFYDNTGKGCLLIDPIDTVAMHRVLALGQTPFALLKPLKGSPVVVKVKLQNGSKNMLVPASAEEIKSCSKFAIAHHNQEGAAVRIKVPVVATVVQRMGKDGHVNMTIEPIDEDGEHPTTTIEPDLESDSRIPNPAIESISNPTIESEENTFKIVEDKVLPNSSNPTLTSPLNVTSSAIDPLNQQFVLSPEFLKTDLKYLDMSMKSVPTSILPQPDTLCPDTHVTTAETLHDYALPLRDYPSLSGENSEICYRIIDDFGMQVEQHDDTPNFAIVSADKNIPELPFQTITDHPDDAEIQNENSNSTDSVLLSSVDPIVSNETAATSTIQYLRPTGVYDEFEVVERSDDATHFAESNGEIHPIKGIFSDASPSVTVDQSHLNALMDMLKNAGYEIQTEDSKTTSNGETDFIHKDDHQFLVGNQSVHLVMTDSSTLNNENGINLVIENEDNISS